MYRVQATSSVWNSTYLENSGSGYKKVFNMRLYLDTLPRDREIQVLCQVPHTFCLVGQFTVILIYEK